MANLRVQALSAAVLLLLAAGCGGRSSSVPSVANGAAGAQRAVRSTASGAAAFHPNSTRYSDKGAHPATGRSGSAQIMSRALLGKDGTTLVEATTGTLDGPPGPGRIGKVQAKLFNPDASLAQTLNYPHLTGGPYWSQTYSTLARNEQVQLQANVHDVDPRTDVVTVTDAVKLRPDLAVQSLSGPAQAYSNTPVTFQAIVSELNGDVGANANCVLSVDGQTVDSAQAIFVDAGSMVSCVFQYTFPTAGVHNVQVAVTSVVPADWDLSNNTAQTTITIMQPGGLGYQASLSSAAYHSTVYDTFTGTYSGFSDNSSYDETSFSAFMYEYSLTQTFAFPIQQFSGTVTINGAVAWQPTFTGFLGPVVSVAGSTCQSQYIDSAYGIVCALDSGLSYAEFQGLAGQVSYLSTHSDTTCTGGTCTTNSYVVNSGGYTYGTGAPSLQLGNTNQVGLLLVDANGVTYGVQSASLAPTGVSYGFVSDQCSTFTSGTYCFGNHSSTSNQTVNDSAPAASP